MNEKEKLEKALAESLNFLLLNPVSYFSESDIHSFVYSEITKKIPELARLFETNLTIGVNQYGNISDEKYKTCRIHREYGVNGIDYARTDLVVFGVNDLKEINDPINLKIGKGKDGYITPEYIFEFGTEKSAGSFNDFESHLLGDISKACSSKDIGYVIHIQRVYNKDNNLDKYNEYVSVINRVVTPKKNIRYLIFIVSIGSESAQIFGEGKVKMYQSREKKIKGLNKENYIASIINELQMQENILLTTAST